MGSRPGGSESATSNRHVHNAFLFIEMTQFRKVPNQDLQWSGDWFYESIGGTMAMSRTVFTECFLAKKLSYLMSGDFKIANVGGDLEDGSPMGRSET